MKATLDYVIGNTAIQIVNTGKKIKVIDVEKAKGRKEFVLKLTGILLVGFLVLATCLYVVRMQNMQILLDRQVYILQCEIDSMEKTNEVLIKENSETAINYQSIFEKAKELGMTFPTNKQVFDYRYKKSNAVRMR